MANVPRETLSPGDLCVIVSHPHIGPIGIRYVGRTVVLICTADTSEYSGGYPPYWRCSGLPKGFLVGAVCLRKIPPGELLEARTHMTDEPNEEELTV